MTESNKLKAAKLRKTPERSRRSGPGPQKPDATAGQSNESVGRGSHPVLQGRVDAANSGARAPGRAIPAKLAGQDGAFQERGFPKPHLAAAVRFLSCATDSPYRCILADWLVAGVTTGLLPDEWKLTSIDFYEDDKAPKGCWKWLYVLDPAGVDVDGNGIRRTIDISAFHEDTVLAVMRMSETGRAWFDADEYTRHKLECGKLLKLACGKTAMPTGEKPNPPYSLNSLRNQFIANALSVSGHAAAATLAGNGMSRDRLDHLAGFTGAWDPEDLRDIPAALGVEVDAGAIHAPP